MTTKTLVAALALSLLAFTLSILPVTTAEAGCRQTENYCGRWHEVEASREQVGSKVVVTCCTVQDVEQDARLHACERRGQKYNPETGRCIKNIGKPKSQAPVTSGGAGGE